jgi:isochorismate synthase
MDTLFGNTSVTNRANGLWQAACDYTQLEKTLWQAAIRATDLGHQILASFTQPITVCDPLDIFTTFQSLHIGNCFFWARPAEQRVLVGAGSTTITTTGPHSVGAVAAIWRDLQKCTVSGQASYTPPAYANGPVLFGGFAFDPLSPHTSLWEGFPDGLLILPRLLFQRDETNAVLMINSMIQPNTEIKETIAEISTTLQWLNITLEQTVTQSRKIRDIIDPQQQLVMHDLLVPAAWMAQVANTVQMIKEEIFQKIVLARAIQVNNEVQAFDIGTIVRRLCEGYPTAYIFAIQRGERYFVGATPERLICSADGQIQTMALAGSAPRGTTEEEDQRLGNELLQSLKNQEEHSVVVTTIHDALANICSRVWVANTPHLLKLKNIQHLETAITGNLLPGHSILEAIEDLHPTPAVGGFPRQSALAAIRAYEQLDRGWYAGPIGWIGASGNGEFAVALRSALIDGHQATLFAGCGIVAASQPESEFAESCLKLEVMLHGLGGTTGAKY